MEHMRNTEGQLVIPLLPCASGSSVTVNPWHPTPWRTGCVQTFITWEVSQGGELLSGKSVVLSFIQNQSCDVVIRWNCKPVGCILLLFSMIAKFLVTVFTVAELSESFYTDLFQRCYIWERSLNIITELSFCLLLPYLN